MPLEATFRQLTVSLHKLHDSLNDLQVTLGDKPSKDTSGLADGLETSVVDILGMLHEARKASLNARKTVGRPLDLDKARRSLTICKERFRRIEQQFSAGLGAHQKLKELARLGKERRTWLHWSSAVKQRIEECRSPLKLIRAALAACWQELGGST